MLFFLSVALLLKGRFKAPALKGKGNGSCLLFSTGLEIEFLLASIFTMPSKLHLRLQLYAITKFEAVTYVAYAHVTYQFWKHHPSAESVQFHVIPERCRHNRNILSNHAKFAEAR